MKLEGDINGISEAQLQFIENYIKSRGFDDAKVNVEPIGKPGDNYVANVKRIIVKADDGSEKLRMIAKIAPSLEQMRMMGHTRLLFTNENFIYTQVLPKFTELEKAAGIPEEERLHYAKFYDSTMEMLHEVILLEDLQESGFVMKDRFKPLPDEDIKMVLKSFAKLHSLSYALKNKEPEIFDDFKGNFKNVWEVFIATGMTAFFSQIENDVMAMMDNEKYKNALKGNVSMLAQNMVKLHEVDANARYAVIQQGDAWTNNIMFKLQDGNSTQCCMIDYQQARVNSPIADLVYFLFCCTDYESRTKHFSEWLDLYHYELDQRLNSFGLKANFVYPRDKLDADMKRHGKASIGQAVLLIAMMMRDTAEAAKFKQQMEDGMNVEEVLKSVSASAMGANSMAQFKLKLEGLVDSHLELGLL